MKSVIWNFKPKEYFIFICLFSMHFISSVFYTFNFTLNRYSTVRQTNMKSHANNMWTEQFLLKWYFQKFWWKTQVLDMAGVKWIFVGRKHQRKESSHLADRLCIKLFQGIPYFTRHLLTGNKNLRAFSVHY